MLDAIKDYRVDLEKYCGRENIEERKRNRNEARAWLFDGSLIVERQSKRFTFKDCCEHMGLNAESVQTKLRERERQLEEDELKQLWIENDFHGPSERPNR